MFKQRARGGGVMLTLVNSELSSSLAVAPTLTTTIGNLRKLLVVLLVLAAGCGTTEAGRQNTVNATVAEYDRSAKFWIGEDGDDLFVSWGVPDSSVSTSDGGQVIEYQTRVDLGESVRLNPWWLVIRVVHATTYTHWYYVRCNFSLAADHTVTSADCQ